MTLAGVALGGGISPPLFLPSRIPHPRGWRISCFKEHTRTRSPVHQGRKDAYLEKDYDFRYLGTSEYDRRTCYLLQIVPKRDGSDLLRGKVWVDRDTYLIHHFEGEPAKSPSGWIKDLKLSSNYSDVGGMWLVSWSQGTADVRLFGPHTMRERTLSYQALRRVSDSPSNRDGAFPTPLLAGRGSHGWNQHHWRTVSDSRSREL